MCCKRMTVIHSCLFKSNILLCKVQLNTLIKQYIHSYFILLYTTSNTFLLWSSYHQGDKIHRKHIQVHNHTGQHYTCISQDTRCSGIKYRSLVFWDVMHCRLEVSDRQFGTIFRSHRQGSEVNQLPIYTVLTSQKSGTHSIKYSLCSTLISADSTYKMFVIKTTV